MRRACKGHQLRIAGFAGEADDLMTLAPQPLDIARLRAVPAMLQPLTAKRLASVSAE